MLASQRSDPFSILQSDTPAYCSTKRSCSKNARAWAGEFMVGAVTISGQRYAGPVVIHGVYSEPIMLSAAVDGFPGLFLEMKACDLRLHQLIS